MQALVLEQSDGLTHAQIREIDAEQLPAGDVTVDISWSGINYKDALAITGKGKIIRNFPMVPGIDFVGTVRHSDSDRFAVGQPVILTGWGVGENHWGGLAQQARVKSDWLVPLPASLDARKAMILGTAGFTAMLCVMALEDGGITPESGDIIVTGASGGVGSTAVALLAELGYQVTAVSGRADNTDYLKKLGAKQVLDRSEFSGSPRPLEKQRWAGAVDTVGDNVLATLLAQMDYNATVAACGLAGGVALPTTVMPFILRNVRLQGVDSVMAPLARRQQAWERLAAILPESFYQQVTQEIGLEDVPAVAAALLENKVTGRTLVKIS
ncbi:MULTISPECIES: acrylyl-CoA reductase (NADPH) [Pectobacterium]|uniref:acrylyl-CoA reductase (NADPH) n=1 Tax=Pectobacterium TaxID=122277 RepID=UPI0001A43DE6|nr:MULTISPECIES: MDR family oxidoreductase [Pectobacterium]KFX01884.1 quinone oxidoreductase [Pectobacterium carotovorum subsp. carotovorum]KHS83513.1 quinone oxidoreductase [Pectobacterium carotovorum subsp. carotovorum]KHT26339.1 quinone oxidoreductase [Pectobacterium carotovorum subsp. carotovorum]KHT26440.1 quinone oxidoreductase [Pectobacterium carotovorum subsp. carotovorum]KML71757.1 quinone oxidoreductase [Pectobacterium carotovorum subsp. carotovorum ICMP 5702]